ncbi:MAG: hypothetical protein M1834_000782 [Cirrosporium novae-zelandiae]|nr:MAG: hypothetical protein M1834_000782 [Cirrosporium novae-zelandiae]
MLPSQLFATSDHYTGPGYESALQKQLASHASGIFTQKPHDIKVDLLDATTSDASLPCLNKEGVTNISEGWASLARCRCHEFVDTSSMARYLYDDRSKNYSTRVISIWQQHSWTPLNVSQDMLMLIMTYHKVAIEFLHVIYFFSRKFLEVEEAYSGAMWKAYRNNILEIAYLFKYPEQNQYPEEDGDPWSIRQTGVYHQLDTKAMKNIWIIIHPKKDAAARMQLDNCLKSPSESIEISRHPFLVHILLISTYVDNWRWYMAYYEEKLLILVRLMQ